MSALLHMIGSLTTAEYILLLLVCVGVGWLASHVLWALWVLFVAVMRLKQVKAAGHLTPATKALGFYTLIWGYLLDFAVNIFVATIVFREWPRELTVSARLWRLSNSDASYWRKQRALYWRTQLLDNIDPDGVHRG